MVTSLALFGLRQAPGALAGDAGNINWYRYRAVAMAGAVAYTELMVVAGRVPGSCGGYGGGMSGSNRSGIVTGI